MSDEFVRLDTSSNWSNPDHLGDGISSIPIAGDEIALLLCDWKKVSLVIQPQEFDSLFCIVIAS